jgi:hypothetical protein
VPPVSNKGIIDSATTHNTTYISPFLVFQYIYKRSSGRLPTNLPVANPNDDSDELFVFLVAVAVVSKASANRIVCVNLETSHGRSKDTDPMRGAVAVVAALAAVPIRLSPQPCSGAVVRIGLDSNDVH